MPQNHSYEVIRDAVIATLIRFDNPRVTPLQYDTIRREVAILLNTREGLQEEDRLSDEAILIYHDVFWDLFRQGIINLGYPQNIHDSFPFFRLSTFGRLALERGDFCFFHDVLSYETCLRHEIPDIDALILIYLKEAMQTHLVGCYRSSAVMTGVALEYSLDSLYEIIDASTFAPKFKKVSNQRTLLLKFNEFKKQLDNMKNDLPPDLKDGLDSNLVMIFELIRTYRNDAGHPSDREIKREQCFINLRLFIPCCKKIYELKNWFTCPN
jgi:hypothetical protein